MVTPRPDISGGWPVISMPAAATLAVMVETYAVFALLVSFLMVNAIKL